MGRRSFSALLFGLMLSFGMAGTSAAAEEKAAPEAEPPSRWTPYGDLRLRYEADTNGNDRNGGEIENRSRLRTRVRLGVLYEPNEIVTVDVRARTGSNNAQQSPHITLVDFDGNDTGDAHVNLDKWYVRAEKDNAWIWAGRNIFPFWSLDEVFWDEDATLLGTAFGGTQETGEQGKLHVTAGFFTLPVGLRHFSGYLAAGDVSYVHSFKKFTAMLGTGYFDFIPDRNDPHADDFADGNGHRKYRIATLNGQLEWQFYGLPMSLGAEYLHNLQSYSATDSDPDTAFYSDQRQGVVATIQLGDLRHKGEWMTAYYYAHIGGLAINSSVAQDEWVRWGSDGQNRSNDMRGHQFNLGYAFTDNINLLARVFLVESIRTPERSNRYRLDLNYRF